jgi:hypothetical protein
MAILLRRRVATTRAGVALPDASAGRHRLLFVSERYLDRVLWQRRCQGPSGDGWFFGAG